MLDSICSAVLYKAVQYDAVHCGSAGQRGAVQCCAVLGSAVQHSAVQCSAVYSLLCRRVE